MGAEIEMDHYGVLGLTPGVSQEEIRLQYRRLAKVYHPDRNNDDAWCREQIMRINLAYEALTGPERRGRHAEARSGASSVPAVPDRAWPDWPEEGAEQDLVPGGFFKRSVLPLVCLGLCLAAYGAVVLRALTSCATHLQFHWPRP